MSRRRSLEVPMGVSEGRVGVREGPGFGVGQQPQRLFLYIGITRFLEQVSEPGRGVEQIKRGSRGDSVSQV